MPNTFGSTTPHAPLDAQIETWIIGLRDAPCAAYVLRNDVELSLLSGNSAFYSLVGCTKDEMRAKYGNRLGALLDAESLHALAAAVQTVLPTTQGTAQNAADTAPPLRLKLRMKRGENIIWTQTEIFCTTGPSSSTEIYDFTGSSCTLLRCISFDITEYENHFRRSCQDADSLRIATNQLGLDYFEYDMHTGSARILFGHAVLPRSMADAQGHCQNFAETLVQRDFIAPEHVETFQHAFQDLHNTAGKSVCELRVHSENSDLRWVRLTLTRRHHGLEPERYVVGSLENITLHKEAARSYLNETQFFQAILAEKNAYAQIDVTLDKVIRTGGMWNVYNEMVDKVSYSELIFEFINKVVHPEDRTQYLEVMQCENFIQSLHNGIDKLGCEFRRITDQNKMVWMQLSIHLFYDPLTQHVLALLYIKNIHEKKQQELSLLRDSRLDPLTNTFNKRAAEALVREHLTKIRAEERCAFVMLDLDNLKDINDVRGNRVGDRVLTRLSDILTRTFRRNDVIGRYGGDEFILFLKNVSGKKNVEERLTMLFAQLQAEKAVGPITCSAGVVMSLGSVSYEWLFQRADAALYNAKKTGKNCFSFFEKEMLIDLEDTREETLAETRRVRRKDDTSLPVQDAVPSTAPHIYSGSTALGLLPSFNAFLGEQGDLAYLVDPDTFDLICGNKAFYDRLGVNEAQCYGVKCYEIMHKRETPCPFCSKANWSTSKFYLWKNINLVLEQEFLIKNKLVPWRGREVLLAIAVDISNDKSIVDFMGNGSEEFQGILSGVKHMGASLTLNAAMASALETIGCFFLADTVRFWRRGAEGDYTCIYTWNSRGEISKDYGTAEVNDWLSGRKWTQPVILENPEAMLCYSYEMYQYMKSQNIRNQRWLQVREHHEELGCISIDNISSNFQNTAFLESFSVFIAVELKKRGLMENLVHAGRHDALTDLLSRKSFEEYMHGLHPDGLASLGVAVANFNNLKSINSVHGFQAGNYFIRQFADMLREVFAGHSLFRLNGDEFLAVVPEVTRTELEDNITKLEQRVRENGAFTVALGCSWDDVEKDMATLIEQATASMKVHKKRHYDAVPASHGAERRRMLSDLMTSLENREYEIYLQPKVNLLTSSMVGAEALIRYHDKDRGIVKPAHFIDRLEKNNLIRYIDLFVFAEVCALLEKWKQQEYFMPVISLNFSRLTLLERDILASMEDISALRDAPRTHIEIEITESVADMGKSVIYQAACQLHGAGFGVSLDDFGTKYTNLSMLAELDFSKLKLDRSLTARLGDRMHTLIMKNIIRMCAELGIDVVAEGIETKQQESILREMQCHMGQGYLYGKPMPVAEFERNYLHKKALSM